MRPRLPEWLALPSWVLPGPIAENALFLQNKARAVSLCCFESAACLKYSREDPPPFLAELDLIWHVHLPLDLDWTGGAERAARICLLIRDRISFLNPASFTLHPPEGREDPRRQLEIFAKKWREEAREPLYLENTAAYNARLLSADFLQDASIGFCLDMGHVIAFSQNDILDSDLPERAGMAHWSAPGEKGHQELRALSERGLALCKSAARRLPQGMTHVLEIFDWTGIRNSLPVLREILGAGSSRGRDILSGFKTLGSV